MWWPNRVEEAPAGDETASLSSPWTIYTVRDSKAVRGYNVDADGVGLVVFPGATLRHDGDSGANCSEEAEMTPAEDTCLVAAGNQSFLYFEGTFDGPAQGVEGTGFELVRVRASLFRHVAIHNSQAFGLNTFSNSSGNVFRDVTAANAGWTGILVEDAFHNRFQRVRSYNNGENGLAVFMSAHDNTFVDVVVANNGLSGVSVWGDPSRPRGNTFAYLSAVNNEGQGARLELSDDTTFAQTVAVNNAFNGIFAVEASQTTIVHAVLAHNEYNGLSLAEGISDVAVEGLFMFGLNVGLGCWVDEGAEQVDVQHGECEPTAGASFARFPDIEADRSFVGKVTEDDLESPEDDAGAADYATIGEWSALGTRHRTWGNDGSSFASTSNRGACDSGTCRIWDYGLRTSDGSLRHAALAVGEPACEAAATAADLQAPPNTFVLHAIEIDADGRGDDDGLCEAAEACTVAPNLGSYQGHGPRTTSRCTVSTGPVAGAEVVGLESNGY